MKKGTNLTTCPINSEILDLHIVKRETTVWKKYNISMKKNLYIL